MKESSFWVLLEKLQFFAFGTSTTSLIKTDNDQLVSGFSLKGAHQVTLESSYEIFSFNFNPTQTTPLHEAPPHAKLCTIQTNSHLHLISNPNTGSVTFSDGLPLSPENYFYIIFLPESHQVRICSAVNLCYLSVGEDTLIYCQEDVLKASTFNMYFKCSIFNPYISRYLSVSDDTEAILATSSKLESPLQVFLVRLTSVPCVFCPIKNTAWTKSGEKVVQGPENGSMTIDMIPREDKSFEYCFQICGDTEGYVTLAEDCSLQCSLTRNELGQMIVKPHPIPKSKPRPTTESLIDITHGELDAIHAAPSEPEIIRRNPTGDLLSLGSNASTPIHDGSPDSQRPKRRLEILIARKEKPKIDLIVEIMQDLLNKEGQMIILCRDTYFTKKVQKKIKAFGGSALCITKMDEIPQVCRSMSQGEARYLVVSFSTIFSEIMQQIGHFCTFHCVVYFDLFKDVSQYMRVDKLANPQKIYALLWTTEDPFQKQRLLQFAQQSGVVFDPSYTAILQKEQSVRAAVFGEHPTSDVIEATILQWLTYLHRHANSFSLPIEKDDLVTQSLRERIEHYESLSLDPTGVDVPTALRMSLFYLENIPGRLIPPPIFKNLIDITQNLLAHKDAHYSVLQELKRIPPVNYRILSHLFTVLRKLLSKAKAIDLANIFTLPVSGDKSKQATQVLEFIIRNYQDISKASPYREATQTHLHGSPPVKRPPPDDPDNADSLSPAASPVSSQQAPTIQLQPDLQAPMPRYAPHGSRPVNSPSPPVGVPNTQILMPSTSNYIPQQNFMTPTMPSAAYLSPQYAQPPKPMPQYSIPQQQFQPMNINMQPVNAPPPQYNLYQQSQGMQQGQGMQQAYAMNGPNFGRQSVPPPSYNAPPQNMNMNPPGHALHSVVSAPIMPRKREDWELDVSEIKFHKKIGSGSFGEVWRGEWAGIVVAVKKIHVAQIGPKEINAFREEINIMTKLRHPNILQFLGACLQPDLLLVTEFADRSSLFDVLKSNEITWDRSKKIISDVARGMLYLHTRNPPVVHRDVKSLNILVTQEWKGVVADFGLTTIKSSEYLKTYCGSPAWTAPEVLRGHQYDESADVYSFGIVLWEVLSREPPYKGMQPNVIIGKVISSSLRPPIPNGSPSNYVRLMESCWAENPRARPSFVNIVDALKSIFA